VSTDVSSDLSRIVSFVPSLISATRTDVCSELGGTLSLIIATYKNVCSDIRGIVSIVSSPS